MSSTDQVPPPKQSQPTTITSEGFAVVSDTEQVLTYPHPVPALPSRFACDVEAAAGPNPPPMTAERTKRKATPNERSLYRAFTAYVKILDYLKFIYYIVFMGMFSICQIGVKPKENQQELQEKSNLGPVSVHSVPVIRPKPAGSQLRESTTVAK